MNNLANTAAVARTEPVADQPAQADIDMVRATAFAETLGATLDAGAVTIMMSVGHRTGLFDTMADMPPATSQQIAGAAALAERYVREWLAVMVIGRVVDYDPETHQYHLPPAHAASLTRGAELGNMAIYAQHVALMGQLQEQILDCFETGAGLAYDAYPRFHEIMAEDSSQTVVAQLFDAILPLATGIEARLDAGIDVLDAGCGRGLALIEMAKRYPASRFVGIDLCGDAIAFARQAARTADQSNVRFEARDLCSGPIFGAFDFITTFDAVHDQPDPAELLRRLALALRPGGTYLMQEIGGSSKLENNMDFPSAALLYATSCFHCTPVSIAQGGPGLGTMWGWETARDMLLAAGFGPVERKYLPLDPMNVWFVARKG